MTCSLPRDRGINLEGDGELSDSRRAVAENNSSRQLPQFVDGSLGCSLCQSFSVLAITEKLPFRASYQRGLARVFHQPWSVFSQYSTFSVRAFRGRSYATPRLDSSSRGRVSLTMST